jgi:hypothetical protein
VSSRSARKNRPWGPRQTCNTTQTASAFASFGWAQRDGIAAVFRNIGHRGLCPSRGMPNRRHPSPFARSGGSASPRSRKIAGAEGCAPPGGGSRAQYC